VLKALLFVAAALTGTVLAAMGASMQQPTTGSRTLTYEGASTIGTNIMPEAAKLFAARTGVTFSQIGNAGADAGYRAAEQRKVSLGGVARELTSEEKGEVGGAVVIGYDAVGVFLNNNNGVRSLTRAQLKEIFSGRATNWKRFGGADMSITVYSEKLTGGRATVKAFKDMVLGAESYGPVKELEDATDCIKHVAADETGITASSMSFAVPGVTALTVDARHRPPPRCRTARIR
jgi:phosphate transport system substrate-binding protein